MIHKSSHVLIATFSPWKNGVRLPINGNLEPMRDYFVPKVERVVLIDQVYPGSDFMLPRVEVYEGGRLKNIASTPFVIKTLLPFLWFSNTSGTQIMFKIRDYLSVIVEGLRTKKPFDLFIGFEAINALAGVMLRRLRKVKKVVYYVSDYSPDRYRQKWFNDLYLWLDRQAAMHADIIWDVSPAMQPARVKAGLDQTKSASVIIVPNALYPSQIRVLPINQIERHTLVFMGTLGVENGPDVAITAMLRILKRISDAKLHIVGGGTDEQRLKHLAQSLRVEHAVIFHGFVADREKVSALIRKYQVAVAPYKYIHGSARLYGDATKIRAYMAAGLPTITTSVPPLGKMIAQLGAGSIVGDSPEELAREVVQLFRNKEQYARMRRAAFKFAKRNIWENEYQKAIEAS